MRTVQEVIRLAQEWVTGYSSQVPGFAGAYFFGGITQLPLDAFFPAYRDVDIVLVTTEGKRPFEENLEIDYCGLMLEVGFLGTEEHRSPEAILSDPELAPNLVSSPLLADPLNLLRPLQESTIERYAQEQWVRARCDVAKQDIFQASAALGESQTSGDRLYHLWRCVSYCSGLLALASLRKPTHRRSLVLLHEIVSAQGRPDLHEDALRLWGAVDMSPERVAELLQEAGHAYDRALAVKRTPSAGDFKLRPHLRPYFMEATQEIIDEGYYREATFWILIAYLVAYVALMIDASPEEQGTFQASWDRVCDELGVGALASSIGRQREAELFAQSLFPVADALILQTCTATGGSPCR
jgi:hypothetical protein